jgi:outer membrane immunogenic protein
MKCRWIAWGATLAVALSGVQVAVAADLPVAAPSYKAPPAIAPSSWTGFYVGGNVGYGWGRSTDPAISFTDPGTALGTAFFFASGGNQYQNLTPRGLTGGGQIGFDWQAGALVLGGVADFRFSGMKDSRTAIVNLPGFNANIAEPLSAGIDNLGTVRARFGLAEQNWLFYATGGLAYGEVKSSLAMIVPNPGALSVVLSGSQSTLKTGWVAGGGVEYKLAANWSVGVEFLHFDLGSTTVTAVMTQSPVVYPPGVSLSASQRYGGNIVDAALNYRF